MLPDREPGCLTDEELTDSITELSAHIDAATCRLLALIDEFDRRKAWSGVGINGCAHWLSWKCGTGLNAAREKVRVARALPGLPKVREAFAAGRISYSKARAITRIGAPDNEDFLLGVALQGTAAHVEELVRQQRVIAQMREENGAENGQDGRSLHWRTDHAGYVVIEGRLPPELGTLFKNTIREAMEDVTAVTSEDGEGRQLARSARRVTALARIIESFLAHGDEPLAGGERTMVMVHATAEDLDGQGGEDGCCHIEDGPPLLTETARRLACDASKVEVVEDGDGQPLQIGRRSRTIPPAIRRALRLRDKGCRFPGCRCTRWVDGHHIQHWADGGETRLDNLVLLCRFHHRLVHESGFGVRYLGAGRFEFRRPDAQVIPEAPRLPGVKGDAARRLARVNRERGLAIDPDTPKPGWWGEQMDYVMAHNILAQLRRPDG